VSSFNEAITIVLPDTLIFEWSFKTMGDKPIEAAIADSLSQSDGISVIQMIIALIGGTP
jgi:hypothetical protein